MQSLYNIAGFLGAQSRSNPSDHGDSWYGHQAVKLQSPSQDDTSNPAFIEQLYQECLEIVAEQPVLGLTEINKKYLEITHEPKLIPINPLTIKVGDIVRLIGNSSINAFWGQNLTRGNSYEIVAVDRQDSHMPIQISDDANDDIWVYADDFWQVT